MHCGPPNQNFGWVVAQPAYPATPPWALGSAVTSPSKGSAPSTVAFFCIVKCICSLNASDCSIFGSLVSIAMSGKMKANPGSGQICICWQLTSCWLNIIVVQNRQDNFCRVQNCGPLKFCGPVRPNTSNMPKAGPGCKCSCVPSVNMSPSWITVALHTTDIIRWLHRQYSLLPCVSYTCSTRNRDCPLGAYISFVKRLCR